MDEESDFWRVLTATSVSWKCEGRRLRVKVQLQVKRKSLRLSARVSSCMQLSVLFHPLEHPISSLDSSFKVGAALLRTFRWGTGALTRVLLLLLLLSWETRVSARRTRNPSPRVTLSVANLEDPSSLLRVFSGFPYRRRCTYAHSR